MWIWDQIWDIVHSHMNLLFLPILHEMDIYNNKFWMFFLWSFFSKPISELLNMTTESGQSQQWKLFSISGSYFTSEIARPLFCTILEILKSQNKGRCTVLVNNSELTTVSKFVWRRRKRYEHWNSRQLRQKRWPLCSLRWRKEFNNYVFFQDFLNFCRTQESFSKHVFAKETSMN